MQSAVLLVLGGFMGLVVFAVPSMLGLTKGKRLNKVSFKNAFPNKMVIYYLYKLFPLIWFFSYFTFIPIVVRFDVNLPYFSGYLLFGGLGVLDGSLEVVTGISPIRGGRGSLRLRYLAVNEIARRLGLLRLSLFIGIGLVSWAIL